MISFEILMFRDSWSIQDNKGTVVMYGFRTPWDALRVASRLADRLSEIGYSNS